MPWKDVQRNLKFTPNYVMERNNLIRSSVQLHTKNSWMSYIVANVLCVTSPCHDTLLAKLYPVTTCTSVIFFHFLVDC